jgi:uncharacterized damage-inducible protein DinB
MLRLQPRYPHFWLREMTTTAYGPRELASSFRTVRKNTIQIAAEIPEDKYDFVAASGARSVSELLRHIAHAPMIYDDMHRVRRLTTLAGYDFGEVSARVAAEERKAKSKSEIVELLRAEGERFAGWLESLPNDFVAETFTDPAGQNPRSRLESLMSVKEHEMHHRGQLMLIQRMLGLVPHLTRQRDERIRQRQTAPRATV